MLIQLETIAGNVIFVNTDHIIAIEPRPEDPYVPRGSFITTTKAVYIVVESPEQIAGKEPDHDD